MRRSSDLIVGGLILAALAAIAWAMLIAVSEPLPPCEDDTTSVCSGI